MDEEKNLSIEEAAARQRQLFGSRLRTLRKNAGLTQQQLADYAGVKPPVIVRYETGRALPRPQTIEKLAGALGVPVTDLGGSTNKAKKIKLVNFFNSLQDPDFKAKAKLSDDGDNVIITDPHPEGSLELEFRFDTFAEIMQKTESDTDFYLIPWRMLALRMFLRENIYSAIMAEMEKDDPETAAKIKKLYAASK